MLMIHFMTTVISVIRETTRMLTLTGIRTTELIRFR